MRARRPPTRTPNDGTLGSICPSRRHRSILHTLFLLFGPRMDREITDAARGEDRERELAAIAAHGATRCPPAFAGVVTAAVEPQEEQRRLAQLKLLEVKKKSAAWAYWG